MGSRPFDFASDNAVGADPRILAAVVESNHGTRLAYGLDEPSTQLNGIYSNLFEKEVYVFATPTGTAANGLALGAIAPPYGAIFCHEKSHIVTTECGAPEFFTGGARLILLAGKSHKITPDTLLSALQPYQSGSLHQLQASVLSLAQATDGGTAYHCDELALLSEIAHRSGMKVHMDGARFANAMIHFGVSPAEMTWKSGVDILSLGMTKNGAMNVEAVISFDKEIATVLRHMHKRAGFLHSKMRYTTAQLRAYVSQDVWIDNARRANANAQRLAAALLGRGGVTLEDAVQANQLFVHLPADVVDVLTAADVKLRPWPHPSGDLFRLVGSFCDAEELLVRFERALA